MPLLLLRSVCRLLVPSQLALPLSQVILAEADIRVGAAFHSLGAALAGVAVLALFTLARPCHPAQARSIVAKFSPATRRELRVGAPPPCGRVARARLPIVRSRRHPPSSRSSRSLGHTAPPERRARPERGRVQPQAAWLHALRLLLFHSPRLRRALARHRAERTTARVARSSARACGERGHQGHIRGHQGHIKGISA